MKETKFIYTTRNDSKCGERDSNPRKPVHYRDGGTAGMMDWVFKKVPHREIFERTGIQFISLNTLYQIASLVKNHDSILKKALCYLGMPDLIHYWLTGAKTCELTHETTTQMLNLKSGDWDRETLEALEVPTDIFPFILDPGTRIGEHQGVPVVAPACHDTASAVVAVPTTTENYTYLSSGTWSLLGMELDDPLINDEVFAANMMNAGGEPKVSIDSSRTWQGYDWSRSAGGPVSPWRTGGWSITSGKPRRRHRSHR